MVTSAVPQPVEPPAPATGAYRRASGPLLPVETMAEAVTAFMRTAPPERRWDVETSFDWAQADAGRLTEGERSAVQFISIIEDHLPGYFALYANGFPVDGSVDPASYLFNRELYHFTVRWAHEEDTHARVLAHYQVASGLAGAGEVRQQLAVEGQKHFGLPYEHAVQFFTYPLVQEKATQLYYQHLRDVVSDPVLASVLTRLARDEARHFSFFADVVEGYLRAYGEQVIEPIRDVIADFRMPLAETIRGYWRWALRIADTASYDHTEAYDHLIRVMNRAVDARTAKLDEVLAFIAASKTVAGAPAGRTG